MFCCCRAGQHKMGESFFFLFLFFTIDNGETAISDRINFTPLCQQIKFLICCIKTARLPAIEALSNCLDMNCFTDWIILRL